MPTPATVFGALLQHPEITLVVSVSLYLLVPRLLRLANRYVILPGLLLAIAVVVFSNPSAAFAMVAGVIRFASEHPVITSSGILVTLGLLLSQYFLIVGVAVLLFTGEWSDTWVEGNKHLGGSAQQL